MKEKIKIFGISVVFTLTSQINLTYNRLKDKIFGNN